MQATISAATLKNWTGMLLASDDVPLVTSVSYGWQGSLSQIGCQEADVTAVDNDFAKLAAKGITIIFASGDSGSGYAPPHPQCSPSTGEKGRCILWRSLQEIHGAKVRLRAVLRLEITHGHFPKEQNPAGINTAMLATSKTTLCSREKYCTTFLITSVQHNVAILQSNSTAQLPPNMRIQGWSFAPAKTGGKMDCTMYKSITGTFLEKGASSVHGQPPLLNTTCTSFKSVSSTKKRRRVYKFHPRASPKKTPLYPSWPASSPWVTAVGSTRFVDQKVGNEEMSTDQFGSGGGFSSMFGAFKDQEDDIAHYFKVAPQLPPAGMFNKTGRATPDVAALGEGFRDYRWAYAACWWN